MNGRQEEPFGCTQIDTWDVDPAAIAANEWRNWAMDDATGQRLRNDSAEPDAGWIPDLDDARYIAARKAAILRRRGSR